MEIPGTKIQFCTEALKLKFLGCYPLILLTGNMIVTMRLQFEEIKDSFSNTDDVFSVGNVYFVGLRCTIMKVIQPSSFPHVIARCNAGFSYDKCGPRAVCKMSAIFQLPQLLISVSAYHAQWYMCCSDNGCVVLSDHPNSNITPSLYLQPPPPLFLFLFFLFAFFCNSPLEMRCHDLCKKPYIVKLIISQQCALVAVRAEHIMACVITAIASRWT